MAIAARPDFLELPVGDAASAREFYARAFGWTMTEYGPSYACTMTGDVDLAVQGDPAERPAAPLIAIRVTDLAAALAQVTAAGGTVSRPIFAFLGGRRFHFRDPDDNELAVYQPD